MSDFPFPTAADPWLLWEGDCLLGMAELPDRSVDAVVTDPPYGLEFMGAAWDTFSGEENRKPTDRQSTWNDHGRVAHAHNARESADLQRRRGMSFYEFTLAWARCAYRVMKPGAHLVAFASSRTYHRMACGIEDAGFEIRDQLMWLYGSGFPKSNTTHLKPAHEPIILARKPSSEMNIGANAKRWGTGYLSIEPCRIEYQSGGDKASEASGRFPANVLLDSEAAALLDEQAPKAGAASPVRGTEPSSPTKSTYQKRDRVAGAFHGDSGGASRFFYCSKAPRSERDGSTHPTVKPVDLMRWLCRLVTPPGGLVLDPFAGTGTTGQAAIEEGFRAILCEQEPQYVADINRRLTAKATA